MKKDEVNKVSENRVEKLNALEASLKEAFSGKIEDGFSSPTALKLAQDWAKLGEELDIIQSEPYSKTKNLRFLKIANKMCSIYGKMINAERSYFKSLQVK